MRPTLKFAAIALSALALTASACSSSSSTTSATTTTTFPVTTTTAATGALLACQKTAQSQVIDKGYLTVATDNPVYTPWFVDNTPSNGQGYESAVAYDVGGLLGFSHRHVKWVTEAFSSSYAPGPKKFDFDINEISVTPDRQKVVTFSSSYYNTTQSIVALKGSPITKAHSPSDLKGYLYGDQIGTTGLAYINSKIQPTQAPRVYNTLDEAVTALETHQVDAIVVDTPDGQYMATSQVKQGTQVGQFPFTGEHYGLLFQKANPLASCVDVALAKMRTDGTLSVLSRKYLAIYNSVPQIQP